MTQTCVLYCYVDKVLDSDMCSRELIRKHVSEAFWNTEVENEVREHETGYKFTEKVDREAFMDMVDRKRVTNPYPHENCSEKCRQRGNSNH